MKEFEIASARQLAVLAAYSTDVGREPFPPTHSPAKTWKSEIPSIADWEIY